MHRKVEGLNTYRFTYQVEYEGLWKWQMNEQCAEWGMRDEQHLFIAFYLQMVLMWFDKKKSLAISS